MEQGSPLKAMGARRWSGFSLAKGCFLELLGNWLLFKSPFTWLASWRVRRGGSQVTCFRKPEQARTLKNFWPRLPSSIPLNGVLKRKEKKGVEPQAR